MTEDTFNLDFTDDLKQLIAKADISDKDKGLWLDALKNATPEIAMSILSYFEEFPDKIAWATDLFKRKVEAVKTKDEQAWNKILADEEAELASIASE